MDARERVGFSLGFFERVPSHLQELLEARVREAGADLHDVAALAAALGDLMKQEAAARLSTVYAATTRSRRRP